MIGGKPQVRQRATSSTSAAEVKLPQMHRRAQVREAGAGMTGGKIEKTADYLTRERAPRVQKSLRSLQQ